MKKILFTLSIAVVGIGLFSQVASAYSSQCSGCTDPLALNYDPSATTDDGSCEYPEDLYSIFGRKFNDLDGNGIDDSEPGLAGWTITITDGVQFNDFTITDSGGDYSFSDLPAGTYTVCEESQSNWVQTYPLEDNGCYIVVLEESTAYSSSCPLETRTGRTIVEFPKDSTVIPGTSVIVSSRTAEDANSGPVSVSIEAGEYDITFASYDNHSGHGGQSQLEESWYLALIGNSVITKTSSISDLPENQDWLIEEVETDFVLSTDVSLITALHSAYPAPGANSIYPVCVAFDADLDGFNFGNHYEEKPVIGGCTDPLALNYDPLAIADDGSCEYELTIKAYKVVCEEETDLPNWTDSGAPSLIDENTALEYVSQSNDACHLETNWGFQWGYSSVPKLSGDYVGEAPTGTGYAKWKNFDSLTTSGDPAVVQIDDLQSTPRIWVREVLKEGYIPFTNPPKGVAEDNVSAEIYCYNDILNYDNYDYIASPELGETYYCVAFNVLKEQEVPGCTDPTASNYDPLATVDDGSCQYVIPGCTDPLALNYDSLANVDDGSCEYEVPGCTNPEALNYDPLATIDDGSCEYPPEEIPGCTDPLALNYDLLATIDDGSCEYDVPGCIDPLASNYDSLATIDDGSCQYDIPGCTDPLALNYDPLANIDDGSCQYEVSGCTLPEANNYNPLATIDDGSCTYDVLGCTDPAARNYNPLATVNDGSCTYGGGGTVRPKFSINKSVDLESVNPGDILTYTIVVECLGSGVAKNTVLTDILPEGFSYEGDITGEWEFGEMVRGDQETVIYQVLVLEEIEKGNYVNIATVQASNSNAYKDTAEVEVSGVIVKGEDVFPELVIEKTADKTSINPGTYVTYEIEVKNVGEAPAVNVIVEDILPEGFVLSEGFLSWAIPLLEEGDSWKESLTVYIEANTENGNYNNVAIASAENHEDEVKDTHVLGVGVLPHTGNGLFDSAPFMLIFIVLIVAAFELLRTVIKTRMVKVIVFSLVFGICLVSISYPFWPSIEYTVAEWTGTQEILLSQKAGGVAEGLLKPSVTPSLEENILSIPKIGVEIPIVEGADEGSLEKGAWLLPQTSTPDEMKNTALAAHRFKYRPPHKETFYLLDKVSEGDELIVQWEGKEYRYIVNSIMIVAPEYIGVLEPTEKATLTLITCHPLFSDESRLIVRGEII